MGREEVGRWHHEGLYLAICAPATCCAGSTAMIRSLLDRSREDRHYRALPFGRRVHNLMQVNMEREGWSGRPAPDVKAYWNRNPSPRKIAGACCRP